MAWSYSEICKDITLDFLVLKDRLRLLFSEYESFQEQEEPIGRSKLELPLNRVKVISKYSLQSRFAQEQ